MKKGILICFMLVLQLGLSRAQDSTSSQLDSLVKLAVQLSEDALYNCRFTAARKMLDLSYFRNFKDFSVKHEALLTIQDLRVERFMNNVYQLEPDPEKNLTRLSNLASDIYNLKEKDIQASFYLAFSRTNRAVKNIDLADLYESKALTTYKNLDRNDKVVEIQASQISRRHTQLLKEGKKEEIIKMIPEYEKAIKFSGKHSKYVLSFNTRHLAQIHRRQTHNFDEALRLFTESLQLRETIGFKPFLPASYSSLGDVHFKTGAYEAAIEMYHKAVTMAKEIGFVRYQSSPLLSIGDIFLKLENTEKAKDYYLKALKSASENKYPAGIDAAIEKLSKL